MSTKLTTVMAITAWTITGMTTLVPAVAKADVMVSALAPASCIDLANAQGRLFLYPCHGGANQNFFRTAYGVQKYDNGCLDAEGTGGEGSQLIVAACDANRRSQKWGFAKDGTYRNESGLCLDVRGEKVALGTPLIMFKCKGTRNQKWGRGQFLSASAVAAKTGKPLRVIERAIAGGTILSPTGAALVGNDGASMVAAGGGNMVAAGGGNMVAAGGGNMVAAGGGNMIALNGGAIWAK